MTGQTIVRPEHREPLQRASAPAHAFRADVQGLRGIAVTLVVAYHSIFRDSGGFVGVDVFFVVSGFVITRILAAELADTNTLSLAAFYARRVRRLLPALCAVLLFVAAGSALVLTPLGNLQTVARTGVASALFSANGALFFMTGGYFDTAAEANPLLHMWTLAVEEQFYLVFPLLMLVSWRLAKRLSRSPRQTLVMVIGAVAAMSLALCVYLTFSAGAPFHFLTVNSRFGFFGSPSRAWEFCAGAVIALSESRIREILGRRLSELSGLVGLVGLVVTVVAFDSATPFPGYAALLPVISTALILSGGCRPGGYVSGILGQRWLVWVGDQSYSWYLWHWPLIVFLRLLAPQAPAWAVVGAALTGLVLAWLTGVVVESPIRRNRRIVGFRAAALAVVCTLVPSGAFGALLISADHPPARIRQLAIDARPHLDSTQLCTANLPGSAQTQKCTWTVPAAKGTLLLLGDSNAGQFAEPALSIARERHLNLVLATYGGCPFADVSSTYLTAGHDTQACNAFIRAWAAEVVRTRPALVMLASASTDYIYSTVVRFDSLDGRRSASLDGEQSTSSLQRKAALWGQGVSSLLTPWAEAGVPTLLVNTVPHFANFDLRLCPAITAARDSSKCATSAPTEKLRLESELTSGVEDAAVAQFPGMSTLNLFDSICGGPTCSTFRDGRFAYRDGGHLSVPFVMSLEPEIRRAVDRVLAAPR